MAAIDKTKAPSILDSDAGGPKVIPNPELVHQD